MGAARCDVRATRVTPKSATVFETERRDGGADGPGSSAGDSLRRTTRIGNARRSQSQAATTFLALCVCPAVIDIGADLLGACDVHPVIRFGELEIDIFTAGAGRRPRPPPNTTRAESALFAGGQAGPVVARDEILDDSGAATSRPRAISSTARCASYGRSCRTTGVAPGTSPRFPARVIDSCSTASGSGDRMTKSS